MSNNNEKKGIGDPPDIKGEEEPLDHCIIVKFDGSHDTRFQPYIRGLDPWQILLAADTLMEIAHREMREWYESQRPEGGVLVARMPLQKH